MDAPLSRTEKSLSSSLKHESRLAKCTKFKKNRIFRCCVADGPSSLPEVFLVKMAKHTEREPYNPESEQKSTQKPAYQNPLVRQDNEDDAW